MSRSRGLFAATTAVVLTSSVGAWPGAAPTSVRGGVAMSAAAMRRKSSFFRATMRRVARPARTSLSERRTTRCLQETGSVDCIISCGAQDQISGGGEAIEPQLAKFSRIIGRRRCYCRLGYARAGHALLTTASTRRRVVARCQAQRPGSTWATQILCTLLSRRNADGLCAERTAIAARFVRLEAQSAPARRLPRWRVRSWHRRRS